MKRCAFLLAVVPVVCAATVRAQTTGREAPAREAPARDRVVVREKTTSWGGPMSQHVWIDARAGVEAIELQTFSANFEQFSAGFLPTSGVGPTASVGAGLRFGFLTLGARDRVASFDDAADAGSWQVWTLDGELGVRVPLRRVEPHFEFAGGYSSFGGFGSAIAGLKDGIDVHGVDLRLGMGVDYWVTRNVSLGLDIDEQLLAIARQGVSVRDLATAKEVGTINEAKARILEASGSSFGSATAVTGAIGTHF